MAKKVAVAEQPEAEQKSSRNHGITSGLRIYEYQNQTLEANVKARKTDDELAEMWRAEYPKAMEFDANMVRTVRSLYNKGKHKNDVPATPLVGYDENKKPLPVPTRGRKAAEPVAAPVPAAKPAATVKKLKKSA